MTFEDAPAARIALAEAAAAAAVPPRACRPSRPVRFTGEAGAFWRLLLRGALLLAVTLGIYRFWLATDVRRFLWSHTEIAGESLEYNGTAAELLIGFLIAIAILVPINLAFFVAGAEHGRRPAKSPACSAFRCCSCSASSRSIAPALSPHPHGVARRALPSDRLGDPLRVLRNVLVGADRAHPRPRLSVHAGEPRTLQDAQHLLRRPRRPLRGLGLAAVRARRVHVVPGHGAAAGRHLRHARQPRFRGTRRSDRAAASARWRAS